MKRVYIISDGIEIGTWDLPNAYLTNFSAQRDLGWAIFYELVNGVSALKIEVRETDEV